MILHMFTKNHNHLMYGSWEMEWDQQFFVIVGHVLPFHPLSNSENQNFEKNEKRAYVPKIRIIIWCMLPEMWSVADIIFCYFGPFFGLLPY